MFIKRTIKKLAIMLMSATIVAGTVGTGVTAFANNHSDTNFKFYMDDAMEYTEAREKEDTSKVYMYCKKMSNSDASYTAHVIGTNSEKKTGTDCSKGHTYKFQKGTSRYMTSYVYENGYTYARVGAAPNYSYYFTASGVWSPDNRHNK